MPRSGCSGVPSSRRASPIASTSPSRIGRTTRPSIILLSDCQLARLPASLDDATVAQELACRGDVCVWFVLVDFEDAEGVRREVRGDETPVQGAVVGGAVVDDA